VHCDKVLSGVDQGLI